MKAVLISIQPKWVEKIASGKKTTEVRKTRPKLETPFKVYIYCTMGKIPKFIYNEKLEKESIYDRYPDIQNGKVIGEFVCDRIYPISCYYSDTKARGIHRKQPYTCLTDKEMIDYLGNGVEGYGWHITELVIYDKPKELSEFNNLKRQSIQRAFQSWGYVEGNGKTEGCPFKTEIGGEL